MPHVVLATDGSTHALAAEAVLKEFPFRERPKLTIVHVCPAANLHHLGTAVPEAVNELLEECRQQAQNLLAKTAERCRSWASEVTTLLLDGHPAEELLGALERLRPDVAVLGARGLGAVKRMLLGSVSERLAKHAPCSVLITRPRNERSEIERILLSEDGSPAAGAAVDRFAALPLGALRTVHLVRVIETVHTYGMEMLLEGAGTVESARQATEMKMQPIADRLRRSGAQVPIEVHAADNVADDLLDTAERLPADLLVVGSKGKSAWERFLLGSVSLRVLHHAPCSVWIERAPKPAGS